MDAPEHVVVGDDGSAEAGLAWAWVSAQDWDGWAVDVVTADDDPAAIPTTPGQAAPHPWQPPHRRPVAEQARIAGGVRYLTAVGDPRSVLLDFSDAALMVVGRRGRGLLKALSLGSTADWLLHGPPCPLVIVKEGRPVRRVLVCADGSDHARSAAAAFARLPWAGSAETEVLGVDDGRSDPERAQAGLLELLTGAGVAARPSCRSGEPGDPRGVIVEVAAESGVDLVVLGTRGVGISLLRRMLGGSVAAYVAHHAACSVLVADVPPTSRQIG